jgi:hypothetical protein
MKYKVIADVNSDYKDKLKSYRNTLIEMQKEKTTPKVPMYEYDCYMSDEEWEAYNAGWCLAFAVAKHHLDMWFPELTEDNNG